ncbi:DUF5702 domain-containing protein [Lachnoclostridium sp.]|uniref:DUF5702 domain-containing protein n=1 Tax=Lachnoclostridium sp. TaxID=2028282 RepID=UPI00289C5CB5|nr:DUF5702 domain-containing protein [Lachnoclostridium sp.]
MRNQKASGVITIYLTLTLSIMITLIVTTIEMARVTAARAYSERVLQTAMESTLCDYYLPLFERYHVFGLDIGYGSNIADSNLLVDEIRKGIEVSFLPTKDDPISNLLLQKKSYLICNPMLEELSVENIHYITDLDGELFRKQATSYMKYQAATEGLEYILDSVHALEKTEKANQKFEEKMKVEQEFMLIDKDILKLMELIDGIKIKDNQIECKNGKPKTIDSFAKKLLSEEPTMDNALINHFTIFDSLKDNYINYPNQLISLKDSAKDVVESYRTAYENAVRQREQELASLRAERADMLKESKDKPCDTTKIDARIMSLEQSPITIDIYVLDSLMASCNSINQKMANFLNTLKVVKEKASQALSLVQKIKEARYKAQDSKNNFLDGLNKAREEIGDVLYEELSNNSEEMERYSNPEEKGIGIIKDIVSMEETLIQDIKVLEEVERCVLPSMAYTEEGYDAWLSKVNLMQTSLDHYKLNGLAFDYSGVNFSEEKNSILIAGKSLISDGLLNLVLEDVNSVSKAELSQSELPSFTAKKLPEKSSQAENNIKNIMNTEDREDITTTGVGKLGTEALGSFANSLVEELLFQAYENEHCTYYLSEDYKLGQVLQYELEYLLYGNMSDKENVSSFINRLILIRTIGNMISVLTDANKVREASEFAALVVGFSGLPFLISVVKYVILFIWALEQSLVETAAMLLDKNVPIFCMKDDFVVEFKDLASFNKETIIKKAKNYKTKEGFLSVGYKEYLQISLFFSNKNNQYYRMMDIIQENLRYEYEDSFRIRNCVVNYRAGAKISMPEQFFSLPFAINREALSIHGYLYLAQNTVSY